MDDEEDYGLPYWAGVLPMHLEIGVPIADPRLRPDVAVPTAVSRYRRPGSTGVTVPR